MAFKEIMWNLNKISSYTEMTLFDRIQNDKLNGWGSQGKLFGNKYYIPADAKIGGL